MSERGEVIVKIDPFAFAIVGLFFGVVAAGFLALGAPAFLVGFAGGIALVLLAVAARVWSHE